MKKNILLYAFIIGLFGCLIGLVLDKGKALTPKSAQIVSSSLKTTEKSSPTIVSSYQSVPQQFLNNIKSPLSLLLLQIITILIVAKLFGFLIGKIGQPSVIGEMIAGIFLGPSVMGMLFPDFSTFLFPKNSLPNLQFLSQIGVTFFMFIVGMELDVAKLRNKAHSAVVISHASIIFPYFLGVLISYFLYEQFAPANVSFLSYALFIGITLSITAFPVLARILQERGMTKTQLGALALTCAAADDVTAWCILAAVIAIVKAGSMFSALFTLSLALIFVLVMFKFIRPWIKNLGNKITENGDLNKMTVAVVFLLLLLSAYFTETIGIHALFGAFLAGVIMPPNMKFKERIIAKLEDVSVLLLLPIFFAFTGLRTQIGLLNEGHLWGICGLVIFVAVFGKFGGSALSAKIVGNSWKDSVSIGALMNTRGLVELIVLNIGYDLGILSPEIFAIMVIMALTTTFMTGPILDLVEYVTKKRTSSQSALN